MNDIVNEADWISARVELLEEEKKLTQLRDEIAAKRRALPWRVITTNYTFGSTDGTASLVDLFGDKSQLILVHFMFAPGAEQGCPSCSFWADQYDAIRSHIHARDVSLVVVSRAPWQDFEPFRQRMGWRFPWYSSHDTSFNADFNVSFPGANTGVYNYRETQVMTEHPGISVFTKMEDRIFHTYSVYARGLDPLNATYQMLDLVPRGRDEEELPFSMGWVRHHDKYEG